MSNDEMTADEEYEHLKLLESMQYEKPMLQSAKKDYDDEDFDPRHIVQPKHLIKKDKILKNSLNDDSDFM
jgi:hypothetical protein